MKIIHMDLKAGEVKLRADSLDDLWYLSNVVEQGDLVRGETERKIKIGDSSTENARVIRKRVHLTLSVEKVELTTDALRILGTITDGPEDIGRGDHHTIVVEPTSTLKIIKEKWLNYQLDKLKEAAEAKQEDVLVIVFDREEALFGILKARGYEPVTSMRGDVSKKGLDEKKTGNFYKEIAKQMQSIMDSKKLKTAIIASPGFWKDYLLKELPEELKKKTIAASCSEVSSTSINEVLKRPELKSVMERDRSAKEEKLVESLLKAISDDKAAYGFQQVKGKAEIGAVEWLAVTDTAIHKYREKGIFGELERLMRLVESTGGKVHLLAGEHTTKKVDALGGIGAVLRWKG